MLVTVLGQIGAEMDDGTRRDPPSGPQRRLLALLAMRAGRPVTSETICDLFELSAGAVRTSVSRLRKLLGPEVLATAPGGYVLQAATDAERFQHAVTTARSLPVEDAAQHLEQALDLVAGPPLEEFADEPWAISEVTRLNELRAAVIEDLVTLRIELGRFDDAVDLLRPHIEVFPYRDRPRELLMRALASSGRQVEALRAFQTYRTVLIEEVGVDPGDAIRELESQIAAGDVGTTSAAAQSVPRPAVRQDTLTNLPAVPNEFVGREADQALLAHALTESRLVTLLGPGGVGKTRLAFRVASNQVGLHSDGVWMAELVDAETEADVLRSLVDVLGVQASTVDELADQLAGRDLLLVVDNCEHVLDAVYAVIEPLMARTSRLRIIATSRTPLRLVDERVVPLGPLEAAAAVELYETRARAAGVEIPEADRSIVEEICAQLDGVPLALELAAASSRVLSPRDLRAQLHRRFDVLKGGQRGRLAGRHDSLRAAVDSSYEALDADTQSFFARLSVFAGEFPLSAVEAAGAGLATPHFDLVAELVDMSMLVSSRTASGTHYRMLETLRHYGLDRLRESGETAEAEQRQIDWSRAFAAEQVGAAYGVSEAISIDSLVGATPNLRLAISRLVERGDVDGANELLLSLDDLTYASNTLATLAEPLGTGLVTIDDDDDARRWSVELVRRATSGPTHTRLDVAEPLAEHLRVDSPGSVLVPSLLITTALGVGPPPDYLDRLAERARAETDVAERARLFVAVGLARYYGSHLPDDFGPVEEAMSAAVRAGMKRLTIAAGSMACIGGIRMGRPLDGARLARPVLADLDELSHPSIMSNGLVMLYTEAAIQAELPPEEHLLGIRRAGPNLNGDFNRLGLALARIVQHQGHNGLAIRAVGACETTNRSGFAAGQVDTILQIAHETQSQREVDSLLAAGAVSEQSELYREMWSLLESRMYALPA